MTRKIMIIGKFADNENKRLPYVQLSEALRSIALIDCKGQNITPTFRKFCTSSKSTIMV